MDPLFRVVVGKLDGSEATYPVLPVTISAWEREFKRGFATLGDTKEIHPLYWLGWHAEHTAGVVVKPYNDWEKELIGVDIEADEVPLVRPAPLPPPSPGLP